MKNAASIAFQLRNAFQWFALGLLALIAGAAFVATVGAALGLFPWLTLPLAFGETVVAAGPIVQSLVTVILLALCFFVPSSMRVMKLEGAHRAFNIKMEDIARAYHVAHADDRRGIFRLKNEFDAVRERIAHLREHPDLGHLEPDVLEIAAQMAQQSHRLAQTYSEENVDRARRFLQQRQEEVERSREQIARAYHTSRELKRWIEEVETDEASVENQMARLDEELTDILPRLGYVRASDKTNVVQLPATAAE